MTLSVLHGQTAEQSYLDWVELALEVNDTEPDDLIFLYPMTDGAPAGGGRIMVPASETVRVPRAILPSFVSFVGTKSDNQKAYIALNVDFDNDVELEILSISTQGGGSVSGELGPGTGTADDPYIIKDLATLDAMRNEPNAHYMMTADVDIGGGLWEPFEFSGELDGRGYWITNLQVDKSGGGLAGFFSLLHGNAYVHNLNLETGGPTHIVSSVPDYAGVLAGQMDGQIRVHRVFCKGSLSTGGDRAGGVIGLVGPSAGTHDTWITEVAALVAISGGGGRVGQIVGWLQDASETGGARDVFFSQEFSGGGLSPNGGLGNFSNWSNLTIAELADPINYPPYFEFDGGSWEIVDGLPRVKTRPIPIIETGGGGGGETAPATARIAGTVMIDGSPAARKILIVNDDPESSRLVGEGASSSDGSFDIEYGDWGVPVIAVAVDEYGIAFEPEDPLNQGTIVHPTTANGYVYEVTTAGTTGTEEPTWSTDSSVQSGSVTFNPKPYYRPVASGPLQGDPVS